MTRDELATELVKVGCEMARARNSSSMNELAKGEFFVLHLLQQNDGFLNAKDIAEALCVSSARVASIVNQLEKKQAVYRSPDELDGRQTLIRLTDCGRRRLQAKTTEVQISALHLIEHLGEKDALEYLRLQKRILE